MRETSDAAKIEGLMQGIGRLARGPGRVYLVGGASAVMIGWRQATVDADLKLDPEPEGVFEAIAPLLFRYPAIDPDAFRAKVERFIEGVDDARAR